MKAVRFILCLGLAGGLLLGLGGCADLPYYGQCIRGHLDLMARRTAIDKVIANPQTSPELRETLERVVLMRDFASEQLGLPENGSYRSYADLERPFAVWNVVATPEFSLTPKQWCFPIAGCVAYRGYFSPEAAKKEEQALQQAGLDTYTYGVAAYSTLKWFDDPVLNTFCRRPAPYVAGMIFHELAHQVFYLKNDSGFNEAFAKTVELEGVRRWMVQAGRESEAAAYEENFHRDEAVIELILDTRRQLHRLYASGLDPANLRERKQALLADLTVGYQDLKADWGNYRGFETWFASGLNNAKLASISTYRAEVPAFQQLLRESGNELPRFYQAVKALGQLPEAERRNRLEELAASAVGSADLPQP
jgi:predicted aminopeptidase